MWFNEQANWYQVQQDQETPDVCVFVSFDVPLGNLEVAWNAHFGKGERWQQVSRASGAAAEEEIGDGGRKLSGALAMRQFGDRAIITGAAGLEFENHGVVIHRLKDSKKRRSGCEAGDGECE